MGERTLDALAGIVFIIVILGLQYANFDTGLARPFFWAFGILFHSYIYGKYSFPQRSWMVTAPLGFMLLMAVQSIVQTIWFYSGARLGPISDAWSLAITMAAAHLSSLNTQQSILTTTVFTSEQLPWTKKRITYLVLLLTASLCVWVFVIFSAWQGRTYESIITPWPLLGPAILPAICLLWVSAIMCAIIVRSIVIVMVHSMLALTATLSIAPIIYRIGYGFDGFLHIAGEQVLLKTGTLDPKPFYYIGQYVFVTWISRLFDISLEDINRWFLPMLAAIILPICISIVYKKYVPNAGATLILAMFPLSMFVASTPQGFALLLGICAIFLAHGTMRQDVAANAPLWLGLWSIIVHPLAGIPLFGIALALIFVSAKNRIIKALAWPCVVLSSIAVPVIFFLASNLRTGLQINWDLSQLSNINTWLQPFQQIAPWVSNKFVLWPAWSSLIGISLPVLGLFLSIAAWIRSPKDRHMILVTLIGAVIMLISSGLLANSSDFTFLIQYERGDYAARLAQIATFLFLAAGLPEMPRLIFNAHNSRPIIATTVVLFIASVGAANAYNSLPRHDAVQASRGWSTSMADVEAVRWIDRYAKGEAYTVLANQSVSAAAIREFGFKRYTPENVFYYPIPTGGPLYNIFLKMTYEQPTLDTVKDAAKLGKSNLVFVVINNYWWKADELNQSISAIADDKWNIENGKVMVYVFRVKGQ